MLFRSGKSPGSTSIVAPNLFGRCDHRPMLSLSGFVPGGLPCGDTSMTTLDSQLSPDQWFVIRLVLAPS